MRFKFHMFFAWYDLWVGLFIDTKKQRIYFMPIPMFGFIIEWGRLCTNTPSNPKSRP